MVIQRTTCFEKFVEGFSSIPLTAECVFYSPQHIDKKKQKEVCDFLIILRRFAILISMKSQEDPTSRDRDKLKRWIIKNAMKALRQAKGALNTISNEHFWCQHFRRGRVDFTPNSIKIIHILVLTELFGEVVELPHNLPSSIDNIPVTYLSVNDFLNIINELRTFPDITSYLWARRALPDKSQRRR